MTSINYAYLIIPTILLSAGFFPMYFIKKRRYATWQQMLLGGWIWFASVALKSIFAALFNKPINIFLVSIWLPLYYLYIGLLTGVFEIFIPLLIISKVKEKYRTINQKVGLGIGFGSVEAIVLGIISSISFFAITNFPDAYPSESIDSFSGTALDFLTRGMFGGIERLSATMIHTFCIFLIFMFISAKRIKYLLAPILLKTLTDGLSLYFVVAETPQILFESIYLLLGISVIIIMQKIMQSKGLALKPIEPLIVNRREKKSRNFIKALVSRLFIALIAFSVVGVILLFGKNLPSSATPYAYTVIGISVLAAFYLFWKRPDLLKNKYFVAFLIVIILIGSIGWLSSISEITQCRPYKCNNEFICARPTDLGMKITTGECTSDFSEEVDFTCQSEGDLCKIFPLP